jgi:CBS domain-containing membrane protein
MKKRLHKVEDLMSTAVLSLRATDRVSQALREMTLAGVRHMPVVDGSGRLRGIVSSHDVVAVIEKRGDPELGSIMTQNVRTVSPETRADVAAAMMIDGKFNCLPVVGRDGELVGIITATDFLVVAQQALAGSAITRLASEI